MDCDCKQWSSRRAAGGKQTYGSFPYRLVMCDRHANFNKLNASDLDSEAKVQELTRTFAREGKILSSACVPALANMTAGCKGFRLCRTLKSVINVTNSKTLCGNPDCKPCHHTLHKLTLCGALGCNLWKHTNQRCKCGAGGKKVSGFSVRVSEASETDIAKMYKAGLKKMRDGAMQIASVTGRVVHYTAPTMHAEPDAYVVFPPERRPQKVLLGKFGKIKGRNASAHDMESYLKRVEEGFGSQPSDFSLATKALLYTMHCAEYEGILESCDYRESRFSPRWQAPKTFDLATKGKGDPKDALRIWSHAQECRVDVQGGGKQWITREYFMRSTPGDKKEKELNWNSLPWVPCEEVVTMQEPTTITHICEQNENEDPQDLSSSDHAESGVSEVPPPPPHGKRKLNDAEAGLDKRARKS
eukprot:m.9498 g.9498  ORF g.9498 m.9498 type:complete len:415 (-) comp4075_c0_seq1:125-1369(-)